MAERIALAGPPILDCRSVHEMAELGMSAREIADVLGTTIATILSAAPECFEAPPPPESEAEAARRRRGEATYAFADRARVLQATGAGIEEIAEALGVSEQRARQGLSVAAREGLHRQKQPTVRR